MYKLNMGQCETIFGQYKGTVQDTDLTKSGEILGHLMVIFPTKKVEFWVCTSQNWDSTRRFLDSTSRN
jgi:hypothetical protein